MVRSAHTEIIKETRFKKKSVAQSFTSAGVLVDDDDLYFNVDALSNYLFVLIIDVSAGNGTDDGSIKFTAPSGSTIGWKVDNAITAYGTNDLFTVTPGVVNDRYVVHGTLKTSTTPGTFQLQGRLDSGGVTSFAFGNVSGMVLIKEM